MVTSYFLGFKIVHINERIHDCLFPLWLSYKYITLNGEKG